MVRTYASAWVTLIQTMTGEQYIGFFDEVRAVLEGKWSLPMGHTQRYSENTTRLQVQIQQLQLEKGPTHYGSAGQLSYDIPRLALMKLVRLTSP